MALDLKAIKARLAAATPGPWRSAWDDGDPNADVTIRSLAPGLDECASYVIVASWYDGPITLCLEADAAFIAAAPSDVAALVAEVERLRALLSETRPGRALDL